MIFGVDDSSLALLLYYFCKTSWSSPFVCTHIYYMLLLSRIRGTL